MSRISDKLAEFICGVDRNVRVKTIYLTEEQFRALYRDFEDKRCDCRIEQPPLGRRELVVWLESCIVSFMDARILIRETMPAGGGK